MAVTDDADADRPSRTAGALSLDATGLGRRRTKALLTALSGLALRLEAPVRDLTARERDSKPDRPSLTLHRVGGVWETTDSRLCPDYARRRR